MYEKSVVYTVRRSVRLFCFEPPLRPQGPLQEARWLVQVVIIIIITATALKHQQQEQPVQSRLEITTPPPPLKPPVCLWPLSNLFDGPLRSIFTAVRLLRIHNDVICSIWSHKYKCKEGERERLTFVVMMVEFKWWHRRHHAYYDTIWFAKNSALYFTEMLYVGLLKVAVSYPCFQV